ncbi:MAG: PAS domain-containing sensor histidine kinase, partial [Chloroflexota bacterium]
GRSPRTRANAREVTAQRLEKAEHLAAGFDQAGRGEEGAEDLSATLEELRVAQEELRLQNDELAATRALVEAERNRYYQLFDLAPDGYLETDLHGVVREANLAASRLLAIDRERLPGKPLAVFVAPADRRAFRRQLLEVRQAEEPRAVDVHLQPRSGAAVHASLSVVASRDERGAPVGLRWLLRDVTARVRAEEEVRRLNAELEQRVEERTAELRQANEHQEEYLRMITHDLRQPLTVLQGMAQLTARTADEVASPRARTTANLTLESTRRLASMISDLAETVSLDSPDPHWEKSEVHLGDFLCKVVEHAFSQQRDRLRLSGPVPGPRILVDAARLERALVNLVDNALKYSPQEEPVMISISADEREATVSVSDHGEGLPPEDVQRLFQRHFRTQTKRKIGGLGLGLYISRLIVEGHGGKIWAESEEHKGSTFSFTLPLAAAGQEAQ